MKNKNKILLVIFIIICALVIGYALLFKHEGPDLSFRNVLLISIDTLRADHLSCYGYTKSKTAHIDNLADEGILFQNAFCQVPLTLPSHTSIMTGLNPVHHGVRNNGTFIFDKKSPTLAKILSSQNYAAAAFVAAYVLDRRFGLNDGFTHYDDDIPINPDNPRNLEAERKAGTMTQKALEWLEQNVNKKFFMWVHYYDAHTPYVPPEPYASRYENPYDGEIAYVDDQIGKVVAYLQKKNLESNTLIIIIADHGEAFGEHEEMTHGMFLYDATIHIPFIIHFPHFKPGKKINELVRSIDLFPTLLELINAKKYSSDGISLIPLIKGKKAERRGINYSETLYPNSFKWSALYAIRTLQWKFIKAPTPELYNVMKDPEEKINVYSSRPEKAHELLTELKEVQKREKSLRTQFIDKETKEKLQALGYVSTYSEVDQNAKLPDPKNKVEYWLQLRKAQYILKQNPDEGIAILLDLLKQDPYTAIYASSLSSYYEKLKDWDKAILYVNEAIKRDNANFYYWYDLAFCSAKKGLVQQALAAVQKSIDLYKNNPEAFNLRGSLYIQTNMAEEAIKDFKKSLELDAKNSEALANLGNVYFIGKDSIHAAYYFKESLRYDPKNSNSLNGLGVIALNMKKNNEALDYFQKAVSIDPNFYECYLNIAIVYISLKDYASARKYLEKLIETAPLPQYRNLYELAKKILKQLPAVV